MSFILPATSEPQQRSWGALFDLHEAHPNGWTLVGGQMVHLHCAERDFYPSRPTADADAALDVRAHPNILFELTSTLRDLGFRPDLTNNGKQHRWVDDEGGQIDVLLPHNIGDRASQRRGAGGAPTIESLGMQQAIDRTETVELQVDKRSGSVQRPNMLGALVAKSAAYRNMADNRRERHIEDFATLSAIVRVEDRVDLATKRDREHLHTMTTAMKAAPHIWGYIPGARGGKQVIEAALQSSTPPKTRLSAAEMNTYSDLPGDSAGRFAPN